MNANRPMKIGMLRKNLTRRPTTVQLRLWSGLVMGLYVTMHLTNHALGLISVNAQEAARPWFMFFWHSLPGQVLLYGSLTVHAALGLYSLARRRTYRMPRWERMQVLIGVLIPYLLLVHITNTRGTRILTRIDIDYIYEIANLWVDPATRLRQLALVLLVWGHFVVGLHFWLRIRPWYKQALPFVVLFYVLVPVAGLLGFAETGMTMTAHAKADPAWFKAMQHHGVPGDPARAHIRAWLKAWIGVCWLALVAVIFVAALIRNWIYQGRLFTVTYPPGQRVPAPVGMSILEVSRMARRPHMSVCGGRARCTTCRVRVLQAQGELPEPNTAEARALARINAPPGIRLACQTRPHVDLKVHPVLNPNVVALAPRGGGATEFGTEREVTVLFLDVRGSTGLAENRLPYDVVFLLNHFFEEMADAVEVAGGHYSNFTGDGLMALFGLPPARDNGARAGLVCASEMLRRLERINQRMADELVAPICIGVGVHTGLAIIGRMGPPKTPIITALGDTVNAAARLESLTKDFHAPVVVSVETLNAARLAPNVELREAQLRGRTTTLAVAPMDQGALEDLLAHEPAKSRVR